LERSSKYEVEDHVGRTNGIWGMMEMENVADLHSRRSTNQIEGFKRKRSRASAPQGLKLGGAARRMLGYKTAKQNVTIGRGIVGTMVSPP